ncbi:MAG: gamma-glutamylcyclotransferase family protein [Bacillota bacterium]
MEGKIGLFSYGTLKEPEIQEILFGQQVEMEKAVLINWRVYCGSDGYFFVRGETGYSVEGCILVLSEEQLHIADRWEEVPSYIRISTCAYLEDGSACEVWVYAKPDEQGEPAEHAWRSGVAIERVIAEAKELKRRLKISRENQKLGDNTNR